MSLRIAHTLQNDNLLIFVTEKRLGHQEITVEQRKAYILRGSLRRNTKYDSILLISKLDKLEVKNIILMITISYYCL